MHQIKDLNGLEHLQGETEKPAVCFNKLSFSNDFVVIFSRVLFSYLHLM